MADSSAYREGKFLDERGVGKERGVWGRESWREGIVGGGRGRRGRRGDWGGRVVGRRGSWGERGVEEREEGAEKLRNSKLKFRWVGQCSGLCSNRGNTWRQTEKTVCCWAAIKKGKYKYFMYHVWVPKTYQYWEWGKLKNGKFDVRQYR